MGVFVLVSLRDRVCGHGDSVEEAVLASASPYGGRLLPFFTTREDAEDYLAALGDGCFFHVVEMVDKANHREGWGFRVHEIRDGREMPWHDPAEPPTESKAEFTTPGDVAGHMANKLHEALKKGRP